MHPMDQRRETLRELMTDKAQNMSDYLPESEHYCEPQDVLYTYGLREWGTKSLQLIGVTLVIVVGGPHVEIQLPTGQLFGFWGDKVEPVVIQGPDPEAVNLWDHYSNIHSVPQTINIE